eukprot:TRINITY_DN103502_c0_g1_i1.p2 TRINITY_DN103502_c0_g1~~TRINITY_DN103502_c0_g1_i1.p2  ORF type:complete len:269 (+),score=80.44 TRINITY_DN103502_c0_g1_i1:69-875(+)
MNGCFGGCRSFFANWRTEASWQCWRGVSSSLFLDELLANDAPKELPGGPESCPRDNEAELTVSMASEYPAEHDMEGNEDDYFMCDIMENYHMEEHHPSTGSRLRQHIVVCDMTRRGVVAATPEQYCCKPLVLRASTKTTTASSSDDSGSDEGLPEGKETLYRQWLVESLDDPVELVAGLRLVMRNAGLKAYIELAEAWCEDEGAAFLEEVAEAKDELIDFIISEAPSALEASDRESLLAAFEAALSRSKFRGARQVDLEGEDISSIRF